MTTDYQIPSRDEYEAAARAAGIQIEFDDSGIPWTPKVGHGKRWVPQNLDDQAFQLFCALAESAPEDVRKMLFEKAVEIGRSM
jgi:hypothetical protein